MTRNKDLKRKVRTRMAKTGEKYSTARAHLVGRTEPAPTASPYGGVHAETAALRGLFAAAGIVDPSTGDALSEAMLLGIGGGLGAAYFVFEYAGHPPHLYVGTRVGHQYPYTADFASAVCERLGVAFTIAETGGKKAAATSLRGAIAGDRAAITWADMASLPHQALPDTDTGALPHVVLVSSIDDEAGTATIYDVSSHPFIVDAPALDAARARLRKAKNRVLSIDEGAAIGDVKEAVRAGLRGCVQSLRDGALVSRAAGNFGLTAMSKWAGLANNGRNKKGWPKAFAPGVALYAGMRQTYFWIEASGTGGGGFRPMYADFLDQAAMLLSNDALATVAGTYRDLGEHWTALAMAMLPDGVPALSETRELLDAKRDAVARGPDGIEALRAANARLDEIEASMVTSFPLDEAAAMALYADLEARLNDIVRLETEAVDALEAVL
jgi:hypothetical protein